MMPLDPSPDYASFITQKYRSCSRFSSFSLPGRKRQSIEQNEDVVLRFAVQLNCDGFGFGYENKVQSKLPIGVQCLVVGVLDGHGNTLEGREESTLSIGKHFMNEVTKLLPIVVARLLNLDPTLLQAFPFLASQTSIYFNSPKEDAFYQDYFNLIYHIFHHFKEIFNFVLENQVSTELTAWAQSAGCTMALGILVGKTELFCVNVGDTVMFALPNSFDHLKNSEYKTPKIWDTRKAIQDPFCPLSKQSPKLSQSEKETKSTLSGSSFEDNIAFYPSLLEGQVEFKDIVEHDFKLMKSNLKRKRNSYVLTSPSPKSPLLRVINSLGNLTHQNQFVARTTVYRFPIDQWEGFNLVILSDGIKDAFPSLFEILKLASSLKSKSDAFSLLEEWSLQTKWRANKASDRACVSPSSTHTIRLPRFLAAARRLAHGNAPFQESDSVGLKSAETIAAIYAAYPDECSESTFDIHNFCQCLAHLAVLRGTRDDATCLIWNVGAEIQ
jgi:hypothetical protein